MPSRHGWRSAVCVTLALLPGCRPAGQAAETQAAADQALVAAEGASQIAPHGVDSQAVQVLRRSMDYLSGLQRFSAKTQLLTQDLLDTGSRVDYVAWGSVTVERPNKLRAERHGAGFKQSLFYDGTSLTLYDEVGKAYATKPAPGAIPGMFQLAYDSLGLEVPVSDLIMRMGYTDDEYRAEFAASHHLGKTAGEAVDEYRRSGSEHDRQQRQRAGRLTGTCQPRAADQSQGDQRDREQ